MVTKRLFFGVHLPTRVTTLLEQIQKESKEADADGALRWVPPENFHVTLHFLGDTDASLIPDIVAAATTELHGLSAGNVELASAGTFPSAKRPRVLWIGLSDTGQVLRGIYEGLAAPLRAMDFDLDTRPYHPHITLGYARKRADPRAVRRAYGDFVGAAGGALTGELPGVPVNRVALVESELSKEGPRYTTLSTLELSQG
jgi:2'-5' RNA ligase